MSETPLPIEDLDDFLVEQLGHVCHSRFQDPTIRLELQRLLAEGMELEDAVLKIVHRLAPDDRAIADEFFGHFLSALMRIGHFSISEGLRRFVETGDLVNSVAGSLWRDLEKTEFQSRRQFLTYCGQRLQWKAADHSRGLTSGKRREDLHRAVDVEMVGASASKRPGPETEVGRREDWERLSLAMLRLPPRDRKILQFHLRGEGHAEVAKALGLSSEAARKALQRAIEKARSFI
ncbi:MAG: sigma-70 family RNA polymerase sigma factor [Planctomycetes bacterium]|nr:sigma-70 family RNA polymerase sigma factor [Planctomycetota bacterium]